MNVKELNNSIMQMFLGKKNVQSTSSEIEGVAKQSFANMVAGAASLSPDSLVQSPIESSAKSIEARPVAVDDGAIKTSAREERPVEKKEDKKIREDKAVAKEDRSVKETKRKEKDVPEAVAEAPKQMETPQENKQKSMETTETVGEEKIDVTVSPKEGATPEMRETTVVPVAENMPPMMGIVNGSEVIVAAQNIDMSTLASLPQVSIFDQSLGEVVVMSGEEFVQKMQEASVSGELFVALEQPVNGQTQVFPAEVVADAKSLIDLGKNQAPVAAPEVVEFIDEQVATQAQVLDSKLKDGQKLSVSVEVEEENFSSIDDTSDLLVDKNVVDEAVLETSKEKVVSSSEGKNSALNPTLANQTQQAQTNSAQTNAVANAVVMTSGDVDATVNVEASKSSVAENVSTLTSAQQTLNSAVASQTNRPEIAAKAEETSFRDVYKGMSKEAVEQVKVNITKSAVKGVDKIEIQLKPEDLGHVQVKMQISKDGKLQAEIIASRQDTLEILQKEVESLQKAFNEAGFDTDGGSFSFTFLGQEQKDENSELRKFIGNVMEQEANEEFASNDNQIIDASQGVNIKV